ncbi:hypothetical protein [Nocardia beijingensis]|uniref:YbaB/EbfC DNA-binding family protein n=1 Tax=Nocardia beijingensis TaxID=95162 RepID=A0ABW7WDD4_9NOCA
MQHDDLMRLLDETDRQIEAFRARVRGVMFEVEDESHTARSKDGRAIAVVSGDGRQVQDISLPYGLGDMSRPAWALTDDLNTTCQAIVDAVNSARRTASVSVFEKLREEFPEAFDLLTDLQP